MKKIALLCAASMLVVSSAFASGVDLTVNACPGSAGASNDAGQLDCAGGQVVTLLATFLPNENLSDFVAIDVVYMVNVAGDIGSDATFWNFATNSDALDVQSGRPASGCSDYAATWDDTGAGAGSLGVFPLDQYPSYPSNVSRVVALAYRPTVLPLTADEKVFGMLLTIDTSHSAEHGGGPAVGCTKPASITLSEVIPRTVSGIDGSSLGSPALMGSTVALNGGTAPVATHKKTWGQLKAMYR